MRKPHTSVRRGDAHADIADGRRFTSTSSGRVLHHGDAIFHSDRVRYNVSFEAEKKP